MNKNLDAALCEFYERVIPKDLSPNEKSALIKRFIGLLNQRVATYEDELEYQRVNGIYKSNEEMYGYMCGHDPYTETGCSKSSIPTRKVNSEEEKDLPGVKGKSFKIRLDKAWFIGEESEEQKLIRLMRELIMLLDEKKDQSDESNDRDDLVGGHEIDLESGDIYVVTNSEGEKVKVKYEASTFNDSKNPLKYSFIETNSTESLFGFQTAKEEVEEDNFDNLMEEFIQQPIGDVIYWLLKRWENE